MKSILDIGMDVYRHIQTSPLLAGAYAGELILQQERTTAGEDVVVSVVSADYTGDVLTAIVHVNAYVADSHTGQANTLRLHELGGRLTEALESFHGSDYRAELEAQRLLKAEGRGEHLIHCKLYYKHSNK